MPVPNTFASATTSIPLSQLDANFATAITLGNTSIQLGNTVTTLNNMTFANVTVSSGSVTVANVTVTGVGTFAAGSNTAPSITTSGDTNTGLYFPAADTLAATTGGTERLRITSDGQFFVDTTTNDTSSRISTRATSAVINGVGVYCTTTAATGAMVFFNPNGQVGTIQVTGFATAYVTSSDYRLKENVAPITNGLTTIASLKPVTYDWKNDASKGEGFIAHELQSVIPAAVSGEKDAINKDGSINPQGVDYSKIVVHLVAAIQELKADFDAYKAAHP